MTDPKPPAKRGPDTTATDRKAAERQRKRDAGLVRLADLWVHPDDQARVKALVSELNRARLA